MENLRIILIILAIVAIVALIINGFKKNSKENKTLFEDDQKSNQENSVLLEETELKKTESLQNDLISVHDLSVIEEDAVQTPHLDLSLSQPLKPTDNLLEPTIFDLDSTSSNLTSTESDETTSVDAMQDSSIQFENLSPVKTQEEPISQSTTETQNKQSLPDLDLNLTSQSSVKPKQELDVLRIYIQATPKTEINTQALFGVLAKNKLEFDQTSHFFIRYDSINQNKVLFKVCNLNHSGFFDDAETFSKVNGLVLFMTYSSAEDQKTLKLMAETAHSIATVFNGRILDEDFHLFDLNSYQSYQQKIQQLS